MESEKQQTIERETLPQHWKSCKLIIDPALTKGLYKVCRYDGQFFNIPVEDLGLFPVDSVRDPRICRLWSKCNNTDLLVPKFKIDECYIGPIPPKEVTFSRLNDNVRETFLTDMCNKYGHVEEVEIFYNPKNKKHLGIAKVIFDTVRAAKDAVQHLNQTSVMGNIIHVENDPKGENRARYLQLLLRGLYTPWTLPVSSSDRSLRSLIDSLLCSAGTQQQGIVSSPTSVATPLSLDTAYSSIWQDTPCSFGLTPHSQGTPRTPCLPATPLSQDSCYSSLQATPVLQGEPSAYSAHKLPRRELCHRKLARYHKGAGEVSDLSWIFKHCQQQPPHPLSAQTSSQQLALWGQDGQSSEHNDMEPSFHPASPAVAATSKAVPPNCNSLSILNINFAADRQIAVSSPSDDHTHIIELSSPAVNGSSSSSQPQAESLDSRIESLLINSRSTDTSYFHGKTLETDAHSQESPTSPCSGSFSEESVDHTGPFCGSFSTSHQDSYKHLEDVSLSSHLESEEDETTQAVSFLTKNHLSPAPDFTHFEKRPDVNNRKDAESSKELLSNEDKECSNSRHPEVLTPTNLSSCPQPPPFFSLNRTTPHLNSIPPPIITPGGSRPPLPSFPFPLPSFPPSLPPVPPRLPNGTIPIPPPGWNTPPGRLPHIPIPPPPIPPPPCIPPPPPFLGPPPPLMARVSVPLPIYPLPTQPAGSLENPRPPPLPFWRQPQPGPPFPRFNPFVPPPDYQRVRENPHKVTVEKVLEVIVDELKSIIKKDITRRMIEGFAFKAFEDWWDCQEKKTKTLVSPLKSGTASLEKRNKAINPLITGRGKKPPLPSFKVKRKRADDLATSEGTENKSPALDVKQQDDIMGAALERPKRRHARPHELDSDDDEGKEEDGTHQDKEIDQIVDDDDLQVLSDKEDQEDDEEKARQKHTETDDAVISPKTKGVKYSDSENFSESVTSERSESSSDFDSSDSFSSDGSEDSSYSELSAGDEDSEEGSKDDGNIECIVILSDEESMELKPPATPSAPLTPGSQLELSLQDWSDPFSREEPEENHYMSHQDLDGMMEHQTSEPQDLLPTSPIGLSAEEPDLDMEMESPEWAMETLENIENLRPLTPTGCFVDSDPDFLMRSKPTSPAVEEEERPRTPGKGIVAELGSENSPDEILSPTSSEVVLASSDPPGLYLLYQDIPKTLHKKTGWTHCSYGRAPATPGRETAAIGGSTVTHSPLSSPPPISSLATNPYITAPKTPGRDIIIPRRDIVHRRKTQMVNDSQPLEGFLAVSSPCSLSESSSDTADGRGVWFCSGVIAKPLQGLENMPGLLDEDNRRETDKSLSRRKKWKRLKRRWKIRQWQKTLQRSAGLLFSRHRPQTWRSPCEERRVLHSFWKEGLDEEDARLLQHMYERLQLQYNGFGWLSDTLWIPHPLTKVLAEKSEEKKPCLLNHRTGSARSEGFYKISQKDKMKYLNNTKLATEQGMHIPAQPTLQRAGSEFRSEQRRLLSTFSCDSDLVKFNQLKFRKKRICFSRSYIHEWGLFAMEPIAADEMVIEYVGQIIRQVIADMREQRYEEEGIGSSYLFRVDQDTIIDATKCGNLARFINHSCNPNCYAKIITVESQKKIVIYSRQPISINEEITYDYKFPIEEIKIPCLCGAESCRGSLN